MKYMENFEIDEMIKENEKIFKPQIITEYELFNDLIIDDAQDAKVYKELRWEYYLINNNDNYVKNVNDNIYDLVNDLLDDFVDLKNYSEEDLNSGYINYENILIDLFSYDYSIVKVE